MCAIIAVHSAFDLLDFAGLSSNLAYNSTCMATSVLTRLVRLSNASLLKKAEWRCKKWNKANQRKAFLDMLAWSEGTDNGRQKTRNHGYDVIVGRRAIYWLLRSPSQTCHADPKLKSTGAGRYQLLSRWWDAYRKQLGLKDYSKSQDAVALQQIKGVALFYLWLIVVISVRQSTVAAISGLHCGRWLWSVRALGWQPDCKIQRSGRNGQRDWCMSRVTAIISRSGYLHLIVCLSWALIITVITPLPTKPSATKMPENWSWPNAAITDMQMRQRDVAALDAKYTGVSWC